MAHRYPLKIIISLIVVMACIYGSYQQYSGLPGMPFSGVLLDSHTFVIQPLPFYPLPLTLQSGDRLDLQAMDFSSRYALMSEFGRGFDLPRDRVYQFKIHHGNAESLVAVKTRVLPASRLLRLIFGWTSVSSLLVLSVFVLLALWRGRGRAAAGMTLWSAGILFGGVPVPADGFPGMAFLLASNTFFLLSLIGLYLMIEAMIGATLTLRVRWLWRGAFILILAAGALTAQFIGPILFVTLGWAGLVLRPFQVISLMSYLVPVIMLFVGYRSADITQRLRLRWMLWSSALWMLGIVLNNSQAMGVVTSFIAVGIASLLAMLGFLYAVLRYRAVDVSVFIDRTLVYGSVTALVVGILAVTNSLVQHAALGTSASLLVQIVVPLALGIVLGQVRNYADKFVERVFFRRKYLAGKALRHFARHCGGYENAEELLKATAQIVHQKLLVLAVIMYVRNSDQYIAAQRTGEVVYPETVKVDDAAFAAARSGATGIDLSQMHSVLGADGYVFQMGAQAVMVCANRPGEHYAADERKLLAHVAHQVGLALYGLRIQAKLKLVDTLASGNITSLSELRAEARELVGEMAN